MLHTVSHSQTHFDTATFLELLSSEDALLLWQDGVTLGMNNCPILELILQKNVPVFALISDITARGLGDVYHPDIQQIDLNSCVKLTEQYCPQFAW